MTLENTIDECVGLEELLHVFGTRDNDGARAEGGDRDLLTLTGRVAAAVAFAGRGTDTDAWWCGRWTGLIPEELGINALVDRGLIGAPEPVFLNKDLVEAVTANRLADIVVGVHHTDVEFGDTGLGCLVAGPDTLVTVKRDELGQRRTGHGLTADSRHLEPSVLEDLDIGFFKGGIGVIEAQAEDQRGLIEEALLGLCGRVENILHTDALTLFAELDLEHALADPPVGDERAALVEGLEIWDGTEMSSNCHCAHTQRSSSRLKRSGSASYAVRKVFR